MRTVILVLAFVMLAGGPAEALANSQYWGCPLVIDDFTQGALPPANGPFDFTHVGLPTQSNVGGSRRVVIEDVPGHSAGMIPWGGNDIAFQIMTEQNSGNTSVFDPDVLLDYQMATTTDLTGGGSNDKIMIDISSISFMSVFVYFDFPGGGAGKHFFPSTPGSLVIPFSDFSFVDFSQINRVRFMFHEQSTSGFGEMTLSRIRVEGNGSKYLYLTLPLLVEYGPPFPLPGPLMETRYEIRPAEFITTTSLFTAMESAIDLATGAQFPVEMTTSMSGNDPDVPARVAGYNVVEGAGFKADHSDGRFEFSVAIDNTGGDLFPAWVEIMEPELATPDVFYVQFDEYLTDSRSAPAGFNRRRLRFQIPDGVAYDFRNVFVDQTSVLSLSVHFEIRDDGSEGAPHKGAGQQLFDIAIEGDYVEEQQSATPAPVLGQNTLVLGAAPSVTSDRTLLRLSRSLTSTSTIRVFDLAGRLVRSLDVPAGVETVAWDTRDQRGNAVASGAYVARLETRDTAATRKLTVIR